MTSHVLYDAVMTLRIRLYVVRIRDYPYVPIRFCIGLVPKTAYSIVGCFGFQSHPKRIRTAIPDS